MKLLPIVYLAGALVFAQSNPDFHWSLPLANFSTNFRPASIELVAPLGLNAAKPAKPGKLTLESFGVDSSPRFSSDSGYADSAAYFKSLYNANDLECPMCVLGPRLRTRFQLPPFGFDATLKVHNRLQLFSGFGGIEAWKADGTFEPRGHQMFSNAEADAWLVQMKGGARFAVDPGEHLWLGVTERYLYNYGPGLRRWNSLAGNATFHFGH